MQLDKIDTVFILMMENRSFDHMLGYLDLPPYDKPVIGIKDAWVNNFVNRYNGQAYGPWHRSDVTINYDPPHERGDIDVQIGGEVPNAKMSGFVASYASNQDVGSADLANHVGDLTDLPAAPSNPGPNLIPQPAPPLLAQTPIVTRHIGSILTRSNCRFAMASSTCARDLVMRQPKNSLTGRNISQNDLSIDRAEKRRQPKCPEGGDKACRRASRCGNLDDGAQQGRSFKLAGTLTQIFN